MDDFFPFLDQVNLVLLEISNLPAQGFGMFYQNIVQSLSVVLVYLVSVNAILLLDQQIGKFYYCNSKTFQNDLCSKWMIDVMIYIIKDLHIHNRLYFIIWFHYLSHKFIWLDDFTRAWSSCNFFLIFLACIGLLTGLLIGLLIGL